MSDTNGAFCEACTPTLKNKIDRKIENVKHQIKSFFIEIALKIIRKASYDSNLKAKAEIEFKALGYIPLDQNPEEDPNKWIQQNVMDLLSVFSLQGHSGSSAQFCISYFKKLAMHDPLSPISCNDNEWGESFSGDDTYQNKRLSSVFKQGVNGIPYYLNAITWKTQNETTWSGSAMNKYGVMVKSSQNIKLPFTPKTFIIDVIEKEIAPDDWEFHIKDESQLKEVFEYYIPSGMGK